MTSSPARKEFIDHVLPQLHKLKDLIIEEAQNQNGGMLSIYLFFNLLHKM
jgi:hypothetical protein